MMVTIQSKVVLMALCIGEAAWLLLAKTTGSMILLLPCLLCFLTLIAWSALHDMVFPMLLFFLPFSTLLKIQPGATSFYTLALLLAYLIYAVRGIKNISIKHMVPGLALFAMVLVVRTLYGESLDSELIFFFLILLLAPFFQRELGEKYDFFYVTLCFTVGIVIAAFTSRMLLGYSTIRQYINIHEYSGLVRYSGFYGDPNFYSAHITAALGGVMVMLINESKKIRIVALLLMATLLVYCGTLSVSKSFFLIGISLLLLWLFAFMFQKGKITVKITLLLIMLVLTMVLLASTVFNEQIMMLLGRFAQDNNLSDFTTKRTDKWIYYIKAIVGDLRLLLFGRGFSRVLINDIAAHNTIIQCIYQFGVLGSMMLTVWIVYYIRTLLKDTRSEKKHFVQIAILLIGGIGPWVGLDMLQFDEFFLIPMYLCVGMMFLAHQHEEEIPYVPENTGGEV